MIWKIILFLFLAVIIGLLTFAAVEKALREWFQVDIDITSDIWNALKQIPDAIGKAINDVIKALGEFLASPFKAFADTLESFGLPVGFAQGVAVFIIILVVAGVIYGIAKWRGWL